MRVSLRNIERSKISWRRKKTGEGHVIFEAEWRSKDEAIVECWLTFVGFS